MHAGVCPLARVVDSAVEAEQLPPVGQEDDVRFEFLVGPIFRRDPDRVGLEVAVHDELKRDQVLSDVRGDDGDPVRSRLYVAVVVEAGADFWDFKIESHQGGEGAPLLAPEYDVSHPGGLLAPVRVLQQAVAGGGELVEVIKLLYHLVPEEPGGGGEQGDEQAESHDELLHLDFLHPSGVFNSTSKQKIITKKQTCVKGCLGKIS